MKKKRERPSVDAKITLLLLIIDASFLIKLLKLNLTEPVTAHALSSPLGLTDPAPVETALWASADHVHAPSAPFSRCPTFGTRLRGYPNGNSTVSIPTCLIIQLLLS